MLYTGGAGGGGGVGDLGAGTWPLGGAAAAGGAHALAAGVAAAAEDDGYGSSGGSSGLSSGHEGDAAGGGAGHEGGEPAAAGGGAGGAAAVAAFADNVLYRAAMDAARAAGFPEAASVADSHPLLLQFMEWKMRFGVSAGAYNALMTLLRDMREQQRDALLLAHFSTFKTAKKWVKRIMSLMGSATPRVVATSASGSSEQQHNVVFSLRENLYSVITDRSLGAQPFVWGVGADAFGAEYEGLYGNPSWSKNVRKMNKLVEARFEKRHPIADIQKAHPGKRVLICLAPIVIGLDDTSLGSGRRVSAAPCYMTLAAFSKNALAMSTKADFLAGLVDRAERAYGQSADKSAQDARAYQASLMTMIHAEFAACWEDPIVTECVVDLESVVCVIVPYIAWYMGDLEGMNEIRQLQSNSCPWCLTHGTDLVTHRRTTDGEAPPFAKRDSAMVSLFYRTLHSDQPPAEVTAKELRVRLGRMHHVPDVVPEVLLYEAEWTPAHALVEEGGCLGAVLACALHNGPLGSIDDLISNLPQLIARQSQSPAEALATAAGFAAHARAEEVRRAAPQRGAGSESDAEEDGSGTGSGGEADGELDASDGAWLGGHAARGGARGGGGGSRGGRGGKRLRAKQRRRPRRLTTKSKAGAVEKGMLDAAIAEAPPFADGETTRPSFRGLSGYYGRHNLTGDDKRAVVAIIAAKLDETMLHDLSTLDDMRVLFGLCHESLSLYRVMDTTEPQRLRLRACNAELFVLADKHFAGYPGFIRAPKGHIVNVHEASAELVCWCGPGWQSSARYEQQHKRLKPAYERTSRKKRFIEAIAEFVSMQDFFRRDAWPLSSKVPPLRSHPRSFVHPAAVCDDAQVAAFGFGAVAPRCATDIAASVNTAVGPGSVRVEGDGKTIVTVDGADLKTVKAVGEALYGVAQKYTTLLILPRAVSCFSHKLAKPCDTLADLAWATTPAGVARLSAAFAACLPLTANGAAPLMVDGALARCRVYAECALRRGAIDAVLRAGTVVELAIDGRVTSPNDPARFSCGVVVAFFTARMHMTGVSAVLVPMPSREADLASHDDDLVDPSVAYAIVSTYAPTTAGSPFAVSTRYTTSAVAPRQLAHEGHVAGLVIAQLGAITRPLRGLPVRYGGASGRKQSSPCPTGFQHPGLYELALSVYS